MLTADQLRKVAARTRARDIGNVEIDVILTYLLQLFREKGITQHVAFKGGTMLRKMIFGPSGRLSTDLDFTVRSDISDDELLQMMRGALEQPYHGLTFRIERDKDAYKTEDGIAVLPVCSHADNAKGVKIKIQVSMREKPVRPVTDMAQKEQDYFELLEFDPAVVPCLAFEEVVAEKIRAGHQRSKIRDLYDLAEVAVRPLHHELIRALAVLKVWSSTGPNFDYGRFKEKFSAKGKYDTGDLANLLRKDQRPDLEDMIGRVTRGLRFLGDVTRLEKTLSLDNARRCKDEAEELRAEIVKK